MGSIFGKVDMAAEADAKVRHDQVIPLDDKDFKDFQVVPERKPLFPIFS